MSDSPIADEDARTEILARVAAAVRRTSSAPESVERTYRRIGELPRASVLALFSERLADYRASARVVSATEISAAVTEECTARAVRTLAVPSGVPPAWRPAAVQLLEDPLDHHALDAVDAVLTGCTVAVAESGTIALTGGPHEGRRALSLIPDLHICVVEQRQVVELLPVALAKLGELVLRERRPITLISGPSATSDIELSRVEGVHGPRTLVVLIVTDQQESP
jgi:L-lactate dehydrogenase complex protein LldG